MTISNNEYISAAKAVEIVKSGNRVFIHGSAATPVCLVEALQARYSEVQDVELVSITTLGDVCFDKPEHRKSFFFQFALCIRSYTQCGQQ